MKLTFRCLPEFEPFLPRPLPARQGLPDWLRRAPATAPSALVDAAAIRTAKHCPPLIDAMGLGLLLPLACDLRVGPEGFAWDWPLPMPARGNATRAPIGFHEPAQAAGTPLAPDDGRFLVKFMNFWAIEAPPGVSLLFGHPANRPDLPFRTLSGLVDCDRFAAGMVHFPALWTDPAFEGVLPAGTPVAQCVPVVREVLELAFEPLDGAALEAQLELQQALAAEPGAYRKRFRAARGGSGLAEEQEA
ncbi:hypothetical protein SAMN06265365_10740 [Tistlia consotensis]|uniref:Uncharacterized protein n=1 Tax=Tistlia consotensis USBA 355 TaxID=560819 RepID=A0A1Y6B8G8_9PROT|nr:hypothetical protein [Tistlia consotensis]SME96984.1 hypothetical protein SAMN05428998_10240 [Tistlia consotensis USBA 355]SNR56397.1 hypothetical protein SAMN06265365_10740 [Tistlia consotensis]